jgi:hypothetical protein
MLIVTVPLPNPGPPFVTVIHASLADADHVHHPPAVTLTAAVPPFDGTDCEIGEIA